MCIICYNDFGTPTPEGINEAPLRLPKCKHVFGDHCIKKWFEESDSCPYCRDKVPSEPQARANPHTVHQFLRAQHMAARERLVREATSGAAGPEAMPCVPLPPTPPPQRPWWLTRNRPNAATFPAPEAYLRLMGGRGPGRAEFPPTRAWQPGERRSPPDEPSETRRRTRARHSSSFRGSPPSAGPGSLFGQPSGPGWTPGSGSPSQPQNPVRERFLPDQQQNVGWQPPPFAHFGRLTAFSHRQGMPRQQAMGPNAGPPPMGAMPPMFSLPGVQAMQPGPPPPETNAGAGLPSFGVSAPAGPPQDALFSNPLNNPPPGVFPHNLSPYAAQGYGLGQEPTLGGNDNPFSPGHLASPQSVVPVVMGSGPDTWQ